MAEGIKVARGGKRTFPQHYLEFTPHKHTFCSVSNKFISACERHHLWASAQRPCLAPGVGEEGIFKGKKEQSVSAGSHACAVTQWGEEPQKREVKKPHSTSTVTKRHDICTFVYMGAPVGSFCRTLIWMIASDARFNVTTKSQQGLLGTHPIRLQRGLNAFSNYT